MVTFESIPALRPRGGQSGLEKSRDESFFFFFFGKPPGYRLSPENFKPVKRILAPDWTQKMLCIIVPNRRTESSELFL